MASQIGPDDHSLRSRRIKGREMGVTPPFLPIFLLPHTLPFIRLLRSLDGHNASD